METFLLICFAALVAAQDPPSVPAPALHAPQLAVRGYSYGNFEFLGSLCFLAGSQGVFTVSWDDRASTISTADSRGRIRELDVNLLVYDEDGFNQLFDSRVSSDCNDYFYTKKECIRRKNLAFDIFPLTRGQNSRSLGVSEIKNPSRGDARQATQLFFVIEQCTSLIPVNIHGYSIVASEAVNCNTGDKLPTNLQKLSGDAVGNYFEFLGALCFPEDSGNNGILEMRIVTKFEAPPDLSILMYDDQPGSFDAITREPPSISGLNSCSSKMSVSKLFSKCKPGHHCQHGLTVRDMSHSTISPYTDFCPGCNVYSQKVAVDFQNTNRIWYFVAAQCKRGSIKLEQTYISSSSAVDCKIIRQRKKHWTSKKEKLDGDRRNNPSGGVTVAVIFLVILGVGAIGVGIFFLLKQLRRVRDVDFTSPNAHEQVGEYAAMDDPTTMNNKTTAKS